MKKNNPETQADVLVQQLLHLKRYEVPAVGRMVKSKQNIMRQVREANSRTRWSLGDLLEMNVPWFFAEPRYGVAALFVAFAALQFWGVNSQKQSHGKTGIYTSGHGVAMLERNASVSTNAVSYPRLPDNFTLFPAQQGHRNDVKFVGRIEPKK